MKVIKVVIKCIGFFFAAAEPARAIPGWIPSADVYEEVKVTQLSPAVASRFKNVADFLAYLENLASESVRSARDIEKKE